MDYCLKAISLAKKIGRAGDSPGGPKGAPMFSHDREACQDVRQNNIGRLNESAHNGTMSSLLSYADAISYHIFNTQFDELMFIAVAGNR